jgi:4a-hydroxytetrahydrobiopterin dehydratase
MGWGDAIAGFFSDDVARGVACRLLGGSCRIGGGREFRRAQTMSELAKKSCVPCRGGVPPLAAKELEALANQVPQWKVVDGHHIVRKFTFPDFKQALAFVNQVGAIAEEQGHHPDILMGWGKAEITTWTHKIDGLTESDFILAAKIDGI